MFRKTRSWILAAGAMALVPLSSGITVAEAMEDAKLLVCAVSEVVACTDASTCVKGPARDFDLDELAVIDIENKMVRGHKEGGNTEQSPIKNIERSRDHLMLQGVENGRGWNVSVDTRSGAMTGAVAGEAVSFMIFGTCTAI